MLGSDVALSITVTVKPDLSWSVERLHLELPPPPASRRGGSLKLQFGNIIRHYVCFKYFI
jgi:hypothetical protein